MYCNQKPKLSDKEWMESVMDQMGFKTKRIDEQQPAAPAAAPAAAPSKTMTDFFTTINSMSQMLGGKTAMPTDPKQSQAFNANIASLWKLFPALQAEMQKAQKAQPQQAQAQQPAAQQPQQAQAQQPQR
jgi:hypothetical protein